MQKTNFLKSLTILHLAMFIGQALMLAAMFGFRDKSSLVEESELSIYRIVWGVLGILSVFAGSFVYRKRINTICTSINMSIEAKLALYRAANITRWALLEGIVLFSAIAFFITGYNPFFYVGLALLAMFFLLKPSISKASMEMAIPKSDLQNY